MFSRRVLASAFVAVLCVLGLPLSAQADSEILSVADRSAMSQLVTSDDGSVSILVNPQATQWLRSRESVSLRYLGFGWYSTKVSKTLARSAFANLPDGWVNPNRINHIAVSQTISTPQTARGGEYVDVAVPRTIIHADAVQNSGNRGAGQTVVIIDTGIVDTHPFFNNTAGTASRIVAEGCFVTLAYGPRPYPCLNGQQSDLSAHSANIGGGSSSMQDTLSHGTHVAGIAAGNKASLNNPPNAVNDGIAPDANIIAIRVFGDNGAYDDDTLAALAWTAGHADTYNIASVNLSLGGDPDPVCSPFTVSNYSSFATAFQSVIDAGVAPVVASGNDGTGSQPGTYSAPSNLFGRAIATPACIDPAISITSTDFDDAISIFSNVGNGIDLAAPGHEIVSSFPSILSPSGFAYMSGTSMATPVAAGAFALAKNASPTTSIPDWLSLMRQSGTLVNDAYFNNIPRIDIQAAIQALTGLGIPTNVSAALNGYESFTVTWNAPTYGVTPTGYRVTIDGTSVDLGASARSYTSPFLHVETVINVSSLDGSTASTAASTTVATQSSAVQKVTTLTSAKIETAYLGGDDCVTESTKRLVLRYDSPSTSLRNLVYLDGSGNNQILTETKLSPAPAGLTTLYARQIVIFNPQNTVFSTSKLYVVNASGVFSNAYAMTTAYSVVQSAPASPSPVSNLAANPSRLSANITWSDNVATQWRVYVDGTSMGNYSTKNVNLSLAAGSHTVGVCAVTQTSNGEYSSTRQTTTFTVQSKISQSISASAAAAISLLSPTAQITASATSALGVTFTSNTSGICSVNASGVITALGYGSCQVTVSQNGNSDYLAATPVALNITVLRPQTIEITPMSKVEMGSTHQIAATTTSGLVLNFASQTPSVCSVGTLTGVTLAIAPGVCTVVVNQSGSSSYDSAEQNVSFEVLHPKASVVRNVKSSVSSLKLKLSWLAPTNSSVAHVSKYVIKYRVGTTGKWKSVTVTSRSWTSAKFAKNSRVYYTIYAVSTRGNGAVYTANKLIK